MEGLFAVNKPRGMTSRQTQEVVERCLERSTKFKKKSEDEAENRRRKKRKRPVIKMGHGGTLDPIASGVLIFGIGKGTKLLHTEPISYLKEYEAIAVLGASTDTYDCEGKVMFRKSAEGIGRKEVDDVLGQFRGKIIQKPPIYSALHMGGKRLYEYARKGLPLPAEIEGRPMECFKLDLLEFLEEYETHAIPDLKVEEEMEPGDDEDAQPAVIRKNKQQYTMSDATFKDRERVVVRAVKLRMAVSSGFYVRSLIYDLGLALGNAAYIAELVRTKQGEWSLGKNVLPFEIFKTGEEDAWAPKVIEQIEQNEILLEKLKQVKAKT